MSLDDFCTKLSGLPLAQPEQALSILWYHDEKQPNVIMAAGELAKIIRNSGLGNPNTTVLREAIHWTGKVISTAAGFRLKVLARSQIRQWIESILGATKPAVDQELGYLPQDVWKDTRGYIEKVCAQLNGCYQFGFCDAASVMLRRLVETLIIEAYEKLSRDADIKDGFGNYFMLRDLITRACDSHPIGLGRDAKEALRHIKELGDRSAHNRRYNANPSDLDKVQSGVRVVADELINIAGLRKSST
jgi:hypothetical protein